MPKIGAADGRAASLAAIPGFETLGEVVLSDLAAELRDVRFAAGEVVVREGEVGDRLFLVVAGRAEVSEGQEGGARSLTTIEAGGFFGEMALVLPSGRRQASVTAVADLQLLALDAESFREVLAACETTRAAVEAHVRRMLAARFLDQVGAFGTLSPEEREALAGRVCERQVEAGEVIVREGEVGDRCFMVRSGSVEVFVTRDGVDQRVDELRPGALFGEASLLTDSPRNASVRALERCELLELGGEALIEASRRSEQVSRELTQLVRLREFPRRAEGIELHERHSAEGEPQIVLKNPERGTYYRLSSRGLFVWERLDGANNLRRITLDYLAGFGQFAPQFVADLISGLARGGFVEVTAIPTEATHTGGRLRRWWRSVVSLRRYAEWQWSFRNVDRAVTTLYRGGVRLLFTPLGELAMLAVSCFGIAAFVVVGRDATQLLAHAHGSLILFVYPGLVISVLIHEAGHAFATKAYGRNVLRAGIGWYWFGPVAFIDTSDMWLGTRRQRIVVSLAGPTADLVTAGLVSIIALAVSNPTLATGLWSLTLPLYLGVLLNLSPLLEFDGYHVLTDLVERPNLRTESLAWLRRSFITALRSPRTVKGRWLELAYGVGSLLYIAVMAVLTVVLYRLVLRRLVEAFLPGPAATALAWIVTGGVVLLAASAAIGDLRRVEHARDRLT